MRTGASGSAWARALKADSNDAARPRSAAPSVSTSRDATCVPGTFLGSLCLALMRGQTGTAGSDAASGPQRAAQADRISGAARHFEQQVGARLRQVHGPFAQHAARPRRQQHDAVGQQQRLSSISWVISSAAAPTSATTLRSSVCISARVTSSSAPNGSSSSSTAGWRPGSAPARRAAPCRRTAGPAAAGGRATGRLPRWPGPRAARARAHPAPADA